MDSILSFVTDQRPKVRKAAHHAICAILAAKGDLEIHPIAGHTSKYLMAKYQDDQNDDPKEILHLLLLLKEILPVLPKQHVKNSCEYVLQVMQTKRDRYTLSCGFQALYGLFAGRPNEKCLPPEMNAKLIAGTRLAIFSKFSLLYVFQYVLCNFSALYEFQPALDDVQPSVAWLTVMQEAYINLSIQDAKLSLENVSKFFIKAIQYWTQGSDASLAATTAMKAVLLESIGPFVEAFSEDVTCHDHIKALFKPIQQGLKYAYHESWAQVLHLLATFLEICQGSFADLFSTCLQELADLRGSSNFSYINELDYVVGKAVRTLGPQRVLAQIPLDLESEEFSRSWIFPVLRENIQHTNLAFFKTYFLPLAYECEKRANEKLLSEKNEIGHKSYTLIVEQIWALLPGFCNCPLDFEKSFETVVKDLGKKLSTHPQVRMSIMAALRQLVLKNVEEHQTLLKKWAPKFILELCNLYVTKPVKEDTVSDQSGSKRTIMFEYQRNSVMETFKLLVPFTDSKDNFDKAFNG